MKAFHEVLDEYSLQDLLVTRPLLEELFAGVPAAAMGRRRAALPRTRARDRIEVRRS